MKTYIFHSLTGWLLIKPSLLHLKTEVILFQPQYLGLLKSLALRLELPSCL